MDNETIQFVELQISDVERLEAQEKKRMNDGFKDVEDVEMQKKKICVAVGKAVAYGHTLEHLYRIKNHLTNLKKR